MQDLLPGKPKRAGAWRLAIDAAQGGTDMKTLFALAAICLAGSAPSAASDQHMPYGKKNPSGMGPDGIDLGTDIQVALRPARASDLVRARRRWTR